MTDLLAIGRVSTATGVSVRTLRYYEEVGLIEPILRVGGKRRFEPTVVGRVDFVRRARGVGFSLEEIRRILDDRAGGWRDQVVGRRAELVEQRDRIDRMIRLLDDIGDCGCRAVVDCPDLDIRLATDPASPSTP